jgi:hypothetical protein
MLGIDWLHQERHHSVDTYRMRSHHQLVPEPLDYAASEKSRSRPLLARIGFALACLFVVVVEAGRVMRAIGIVDFSYAWDNWWDIYLPSFLQRV